MTQTQQVTTRTQLKGYGATQYQARKITQNLTPIGINNRSYSYSLVDVISSIKQYLSNSRIKSKTRNNLQVILQILLDRLDNVVKVPFIQGNDPELNQLSKELFKKIVTTNNYLTELEANIASIKGKNNF